MNKTFAVSDLHGQGQLWKQIKKYLDSTDTLYYLGDAIDKGPDGIDIMLDLLKMPNVIYLKGNHEDFFAKEGFSCFCYNNYSALWMDLNGGYETVLSMQKKWDNTNPVHEKYINKITKKINHLPYKAKYINKNGQIILLSHSGYYRNIELSALEEEYLWNRNHFYDKWEYGNNTFIIHGHTPCDSIISEIYNKDIIFFCNTKKESENLFREAQEILTKWDKEPFVFNYCNGHKIDLDLNSCETNKIALFNLDTLKVEKYFIGEINETE
jgi:serine/threonine protein phosphatase 1